MKTINKIILIAKIFGKGLGSLIVVFIPVVLPLAFDYIMKGLRFALSKAVKFAMKDKGSILYSAICSLLITGFFYLVFVR